MKQIARFFSYLFHPILMPLVGLIIIFNSGIFLASLPAEVIRFTYLIVSLFGVIIPLTLFCILVYWHLLQDIEISERKERFIPTILTIISIFVLFILINRTVPIRLLRSFTLSMEIVLISYLISNLKLKTSLHMLGLGGITGLISIISFLYRADLFFWLSAVLLVSGIVGSARLHLKAHNLAEIILGYFIGFCGVTGTLLFFN
jgi:hypothetical protein